MAFDGRCTDRPDSTGENLVFVCLFDRWSRVLTFHVKHDEQASRRSGRMQHEEIFPATDLWHSSFSHSLVGRHHGHHLQLLFYWSCGISCCDAAVYSLYYLSCLLSLNLVFDECRLAQALTASKGPACNSSLQISATIRATVQQAGFLPQERLCSSL